jgi:hypothetical protein
LAIADVAASVSATANTSASTHFLFKLGPFRITSILLHLE